MTRTLTPPKHTSTPKEQLAPDSYPARLISLIYLGTQPPSPKAKFPKDQIKVRLTWEFPTEQKEFKEWEELKPYILSREFPLSMYKKSALRPFVEAMLGKSLWDDEADNFDVLSLVWNPYFATIIHNEAWYADIQSAIKLPKSIACPDQVLPTQIILEEDWEKEWDNLPEFIQKKIAQSREYSNSTPLQSEDWDVLNEMDSNQ